MNVLSQPESAAPDCATTARKRDKGWAPALSALGTALLLFGWLFAEEGAAAVQVWNDSTAYNHCWLVAPIAAWLAWQRRHRLVGLTPAPLTLAAVLMLPAGIAWLAAERLGIMEGRQLAAMGMLWGLVLAVLGWRVCRAMAAPLLYLVFLVPFGEFTTPLLQNATAWMIEVGLRALDISYHREGLFIETTSGLYHVAEACAGLRFLIAALAFGALYALTMFRSPGRRLVVLVLAVAVPVVANGLRALGIVVLGQYLGSAQAAAADHVIYGWGFFSAVILLLILAGLPFRQDGADAASVPSSAARSAGPAPRRRSAAQGWIAAGLALALAAAGPTTTAALTAVADRTGPQTVPMPLAAPPGCEAHAGSGDGRDDVPVLRCPGATVSARLLTFSPFVTWRAVSTERWRLGGGDTDRIFVLALPDGQAHWQIRLKREGGDAIATAAWLNGQPAGDGMRSRLVQAWNSLGGGTGAPVLAVVEASPVDGMDTQRFRLLLERVLAAQEQTDRLAGRAAALSGVR